MPSKEKPGLCRRAFLKMVCVLGLCAGLPAKALARVLDVFPTRTVEKGEFHFDPDTGMVTEGGKRRPYRLVLDGMVEESAALDYRALRNLGIVERTADFHCVEGWSLHDVRWGGIPAPVLLERAKPSPGARYAVFHSLGRTRHEPGGLDHYVECLPLADLENPGLGYMLALNLDGDPLEHDRGAPARLVTPFDLAYKSIKFVERIEFTEKPVDGWWTRANSIYPRVAPVQPSRLREPDPRR